MPSSACNKKQNVSPARGGSLKSVIDDGFRIRALILADDGNADALAPYFELLDGTGAKGIGGGQHDTVSLAGEPVGQFGDAGGFAGAVDADHQNDSQG